MVCFYVIPGILCHPANLFLSVQLPLLHVLTLNSKSQEAVLFFSFLLEVILATLEQMS